jgi:hypothetical protein
MNSAGDFVSNGGGVWFDRVNLVVNLAIFIDESELIFFDTHFSLLAFGISFIFFGTT